MVKHLGLRRINRRSSSLRPEYGSPPSSLPVTRPNSASGFSSRPSNKARRSRDHVNAYEDQPQGSTSNLADILNSATRPPSPTCAMYLPSQEVHICPVNECDCRKSLSPTRRSTQIPQRIADLRIVLLCTSVNSFTQLAYARLKERSSPQGDVAIKIFYPGTQCTNGTSDLIHELVEFRTDIILCPFLTAKIPAELYNRFLTLVVHPGPPGDVGPSALDWTLAGDDGIESDAALVMQALRSNSRPATIRSHWGCVVFQADEEMDKGPVWAWEQYLLPNESVTKGYLYHFGHSPAAWKALDTALGRVVKTAVEANFYVKKVIHHDDVPSTQQLDELCDEDLEIIQARVSSQARLHVEEATHPSQFWAEQIAPQPDWGIYPVSHNPDSEVTHSCGTLAHRPLIKPADRKVDWDHWTAEKIVQFVSAFDSQPGAGFHPKTASTKKLFIYGAHIQHNAAPQTTWQHRYAEWQDIPNGTAIAVRAGAVFFKTEPEGSKAVGVWITHGRVLKPVGSPIEPKVALESALRDGGHGEILASAAEWTLDWTRYRKGDWQEAYIHSRPHPLGVIQFVYWSFYNGAFTTENCEVLLRVLQWAGHTYQGHKVVALVLMGGHYFSNGIALNAIEHRGNAAPNPEDADQWAGEETWANISAIDDVVEYLAGDTNSERSAFLEGKKSLCERGVTTIAVLRGNAAAGGVAVAAACDVVFAAENTVLNPAYRAMGLHGSEFHSWSYRTRCGDEMAASLLRAMIPMTAAAASEVGLVDLVYSREHDHIIPPSHGPDIETENMVAMSIWPEVSLKCAPWCFRRPHDPTEVPPTILTMAQNKVVYFSRARYEFSLPPLVYFRNEELSQMLLDCHHPQRSQRYHTRRRAFIRKTKCGKTPSRYAPAIKGLVQDEEHFIGFDAVGDWARGSEWVKFLEEPIPPMLRSSAWTRIVLFPEQEQILCRANGYQYEGPFTNFERMLQRISRCCSADSSLNFHELVNRLIVVSALDPRAHTIVPNKPAGNIVTTYSKWVTPQLAQISRRRARAERQAREAGATAALQEYHDAPPHDPFNALGRLELPAVPSFGSLVDMSTAPSSDTQINTPPRPRLPFSRSASPVQGEINHLGSSMLQDIVTSCRVEPPPPQSRRYSRLNTGDPDLLSRAAGPSGRTRRPTP